MSQDNTDVKGQNHAPEKPPFKVLIEWGYESPKTRDVTESFAPLVLNIQEKIYNVELVDNIDTIYFLPNDDRISIFRRGKATPDSYQLSTDALGPLMGLLEEETDPTTLHVLVARAISSIFLAPFMTHENNVILPSTDFNEFETAQDGAEAAMVVQKMQKYCCGMDLFLLAVPFELNLESNDQEIIFNFEQISTTSQLSRKRSRECNEKLIYDAIKAYYVEYGFIDDVSETEDESQAILMLWGKTGYILDGARKTYEFEFLENALCIKLISKEMKSLKWGKMYPDLSTMNESKVYRIPLASLEMLCHLSASNSITARAVKYLETFHLESRVVSNELVSSELVLNPKIKLNNQTLCSILINDFAKSNIPLMDEKIYHFVIKHGSHHASDAQMRHFIAIYLDEVIAKNQEKMRHLALSLESNDRPDVEKINELTDAYTEAIIAIDFQTYCKNPVLRSVESLGLHHEAVEDICDKLSSDIVDYFTKISGSKHGQVFFKTNISTGQLEKLPRILLKSLMYKSIVSHATNSSQNKDLTYSVLKKSVLDSLTFSHDPLTSRLQTLSIEHSNSKPG